MSDPELQIAYNRAKTNAITTLPAYDEKALYAPIARVELARMLVVFSKTVLGKVVTDRPVCQIENYKDYANISLSLRPYVQDACDLSIMGVSTTGALIEWFKPYSTVTRAEFGTVLSRMLYGSGYDTNNSEEWYLPHLEALSRD
ncbi:hypothetical protein KBC03_06210 [Patescibacteria group bacterium]|nr:hypothetical protein [Patescibacteria group bacterium]